MEEAQAAVSDSPDLSELYEHELHARSNAEEELLGEATVLREEASGLTERDARLEEEEAQVTGALRLELEEFEDQCRRATAESRALVGDNSERKAARDAEQVNEVVEEAKAREESLEEERVRLQEELGTLRFSLKERKSFQHHRAQDLDSTAKRLERQRKKLEDEQAVRARTVSEASAAEVASTEGQLKRLQQLNGLLTAQAREAHEDRELKQQEHARLLAERKRLVASEEEESREFSNYHERLDELSEVEGSLRRETRSLRNQAQLLMRHVETLTKTATQTGLQLEEAECVHGKLHEEEQASERRAEIIGWKLQMAETQLRKPQGKRSKGGAKDSAAASASSDSPAGASSSGAALAVADSVASAALAPSSASAASAAGASSAAGAQLRTEKACPRCRVRWPERGPPGGACPACNLRGPSPTPPPRPSWPPPAAASASAAWAASSASAALAAWQQPELEPPP